MNLFRFYIYIFFGLIIVISSCEKPKNQFNIENQQDKEAVDTNYRIPDDFPAGIKQPQNSKITAIIVSGGQTHVSFETSDDLNTVIESSKSEAENAGYTSKGQSKLHIMDNLHYQKGSKELNYLFITDDIHKKIIISVSYN